MYEKGKFKVRQADNRKEVITILQSLGRGFSGSLLCKKCGKPALDCILGECDSCISTFSHLSDSFETDYPSESFKNIEDGIRKIQSESLELGNYGESAIDTFQEVIESSIEILLNTKGLENLRLGNFIISISKMNIETVKIVREKRETLSGEKFRNEENSFHDYLWRSNMDLIGTLSGTDENFDSFERNTSAAVKILGEIEEDSGYDLRELGDRIEKNKSFVDKLRRLYP